MSMVRFWYHLSMLSVESSKVIWLRSVKLTLGGPAAIDEAARIISEKTVASGEMPGNVALGKTPLAMTVAYRRAVRANLYRLRG